MLQHFRPTYLFHLGGNEKGHRCWCWTIFYWLLQISGKHDKLYTAPGLSNFTSLWRQPSLIKLLFHIGKKFEPLKIGQVACCNFWFYGKIIITIIIFSWSNSYFMHWDFDEKRYFVVFFHEWKNPQFNFLSQNLSLERNFFKWDGKVTKIWHLLFHRIWKKLSLYYFGDSIIIFSKFYGKVILVTFPSHL